MNRVMLIGNLSRDTELQTTPNGVSVCKFSLAVNRRFVNADGNRECDFFNVVAWRQLGENVAKFCRKGSKVCVSGQLQTRSYDDKDGVKRHVTDIVADEVEFLTPKGNEQQSANTDATEPQQEVMTPGTDESLPF